MYHDLARKPYPSDVTDAQWDLLAPFIPEPSPDATRETISRREIVNAILYLLRTGCSWRQMPHDLLERARRSTIISASGNSTAPGRRR